MLLLDQIADDRWSEITTSKSNTPLEGAIELELETKPIFDTPQKSRRKGRRNSRASEVSYEGSWSGEKCDREVRGAYPNSQEFPERKAIHLQDRILQSPWPGYMHRDQWRSTESESTPECSNYSHNGKPMDNDSKQNKYRPHHPIAVSERLLDSWNSGSSSATLPWREPSYFTCTFAVGIIDNEEFPVAKYILGPRGDHFRTIARQAGQGSKIRLRGKGSLKRDRGAESDEPLHISIYCLQYDSYERSKKLVAELLNTIYKEYRKHTGTEVPIHLVEPGKRPD